MSQRIVTECDECLALGENRVGATIRVRALSVDVEVDLCETHLKPLVESLERFADLGRSPTAPAARDVVCPECGRTFSSTLGVATHRRRSHGVAGTRRQQAELPTGDDDGSSPFACPVCGKRFAKRQGLGAHRSRSHGYRRLK